ncbi:hypothetical protein ACLB2K_013062 [Fragaria x ananassa]
MQKAEPGQGDLNDHESLVKAIKQVDVVISTVGYSWLADHGKIIAAVKEAGNVKRFFPSDFGNDVDRAHAVEPAKTAILTTTLTEPIAALTNGFDTAKEIWDCLACHFSQKSVANTASLKMQLLDLQKGNQSIDDYLRHAKSIADSLAAINKPVPDEDLVVATLHGLGSDYLMFRITITQNPPLPDFTELRARILAFDNQHQRSPENHSVTALFSSNSQPGRPTCSDTM